MGYLRWIVILFCFLGMVACHQDVPHFRIGVAQCSDDSWRHKMNDEILREAMFYDGVAVETGRLEMITASRRKMSVILWIKELIYLLSQPTRRLR